MDTTQDIAKVDQMSQIFRYVTIESYDTIKRIYVLFGHSERDG